MAGMMENVLSQFETLQDVVRRATEGDYTEQIGVSGDHPVGRMAGGLEVVFADVIAAKDRLTVVEERLDEVDAGVAIIEINDDQSIVRVNSRFETLVDCRGK